MTTTQRPVKRETVTTYRGRPLVITLRDRYIEIAEKGRHTSVSLTYGDLYELALKVRANGGKR